MAAHFASPHPAANAAGPTSFEQRFSNTDLLVLASHKSNAGGVQKDKGKRGPKTPEEPDPGDGSGIGGGLTCSPDTAYDATQFDHVLEDFEQTETLRLEGAEWDNTLVRNCRIHDTPEDGIFVKNVRNVVVTGCEIWNVGGKAIKTSSTGSTENVTIDGNNIHDTAGTAIHSPQRSADGIDHKNLKILNNVIENTGLEDTEGSAHPIYVQSQDFLIEGNVIAGSRGGNGISVRSSGVVRCNKVSGTSYDGKPAIRYYSDHQTGISNTLLIEKNDVVDDTIGIDLKAPTDRSDGQTGLDHVVKNFIIRYNSVEAGTPIRIAEEYEVDPFTVQVYDNSTIQR